VTTLLYAEIELAFKALPEVVRVEFRGDETWVITSNEQYDDGLMDRLLAIELALLSADPDIPSVVYIPAILLPATPGDEP
jgi:hypothetical protein